MPSACDLPRPPKIVDAVPDCRPGLRLVQYRSPQVAVGSGAGHDRSDRSTQRRDRAGCHQSKWLPRPPSLGGAAAARPFASDADRCRSRTRSLVGPLDPASSRAARPSRSAAPRAPRRRRAVGFPRTPICSISMTHEPGDDADHPGDHPLPDDAPPPAPTRRRGDVIRDLDAFAKIQRHPCRR